MQNYVPVYLQQTLSGELHNVLSPLTAKSLKDCQPFGVLVGPHIHSRNDSCLLYILAIGSSLIHLWGEQISQTLVLDPVISRLSKRGGLLNS
jgi:hypothetical protein